MSKYKLYNGDCLEIMDKLIKDGVIVDAILCDPPYGTTACKWDTVIPFDEMWSRLNKLIKPNGAIVLNSTQPFTTKLISSNIENFKYCWYWKKKNAPNYPHAKNMPLKIIEEICVFSMAKIGHKTQLKNKRMEYNPQGLEKCEYYRSCNRGKSNEDLYIRPSHKGIQKVEFKNYPNSILEFDYDYKKQVHPTQKPVDLLEYLIKTYTNENEIVLDFAMGSGSTGVACMNTNRKFIGIELDKNYFNIAKQRIGEACK